MKDYRVFWTDEVDSTNNWAAQQARAGAASGSLYVALRQSAGRGRLSRGWQSEGGGVYMTLLLRPEIPPARLSRVPLAISVAVCGALRTLGVQALIKWPNDVVVGGKKICGILCESRVEDARVAWCVAGSGINLTQTEADFPPELREKATSLALETRREITREQVVSAYLEAAAQWIPACFHDDPAFMQEYRALSATLGQTVRVIQGDAEWMGKAADILPDGALTVVTDDGLRKVYAGDVSVRGADGYV